MFVEQLGTSSPETRPVCGLIFIHEREWVSAVPGFGKPVLQCEGLIPLFSADLEQKRRNVEDESIIGGL